MLHEAREYHDSQVAPLSSPRLTVRSSRLPRPLARPVTAHPQPTPIPARSRAVGGHPPWPRRSLRRTALHTHSNDFIEPSNDNEAVFMQHGCYAPQLPRKFAVATLLLRPTTHILLSVWRWERVMHNCTIRGSHKVGSRNMQRREPSRWLPPGRRPRRRPPTLSR